MVTTGLFNSTVPNPNGKELKHGTLKYALASEEA